MNHTRKTGPRKVLLIGTVWPETDASAAGLRSWSLCTALLSRGWEVTFQSLARENPHAERLRKNGILTASYAPNDPAFDTFVTALAPEIVIFDRFMTEEQFGWRVAAHVPGALRVLDTIDLHFLRRAREEAVRAGTGAQEISDARLPLLTEDALRELAAIHRSDVSWLVSEFEFALLTRRFQMPRERLELLSLFYDEPRAGPAFGEREGFSFIGNFRHPPNADAVRWLAREVWPAIRARVPGSELQIYGAYPPREMMALDRPESGFRVCGSAPDQYAALARHRVNLAPLRFGAGIKGKISDGWLVGTPAVATSIGAEGMGDDEAPWGGRVADSVEDFAQAAAALYQEENLWRQCSDAGKRILRARFGRAEGERRLFESLEAAIDDLAGSRERNVVGAMLRHQLHRSTEYFSRWIEAKNLHVRGP